MEATGTPDILIPGLSLEQSNNTILFLRLVCNARTLGCKSLILKQRILTHNQYERKRNPDTGKMEFVYENGARILKGQAGKDWTKPSIYDLVTSKDLLNEHEYHYSYKVEEMYAFWDEEDKKYKIVTLEKHVHDPRPAVIDAIINSDEKTKFLFVPTLVEPHKMMTWKQTRKGVAYRTQNSYSTQDVRYGRCLWVDIDGHSLSAEQITWLNPLAIDRLMELLPDYCEKTNIPMPAVVNSGRGVHLYWWLEKIVNIQDEERQKKFKWVLNQLSTWAKNLIAHDDLCNDIWKSDTAVSAVYHLMNLPGCIHPKTGQRRYVVNTYGVDYHLCSYDSLCKAFEEPAQQQTSDLISTVVQESPEQLSLFDNLPGDRAPRQLVSNTDTPPSSVASIDVQKDTPEQSPSDDVPQESFSEELPRQDPPTHYRNIPTYNARMNKLLRWAAGRQWDLYGCRRKFLLYIGILFQCGATCNLTDPSVYPLHEINAMLLDPLDRGEVDEVIRSLSTKAAHDAPYKIRDITIADNLEMTTDERSQYCIKGQYQKTDYQPTYTFRTKLQEIMATTDWDPENECFPAFRQRCHDLTIAWFDSNRHDKNRNAARTRRNKAKPGYNPKGGHPRSYTDAQREQCLALRAEGYSYRKIASELGCPLGTVQRILSNMCIDT